MISQKTRTAKWKIYGTLVALIAIVTMGFTALTAYVAYPTAEHRKVGQELATLTEDVYSQGGADLEKITNSSEYKALANSQENIYTTRMGIGSSVLSTIINIAIIAALYRYLRRNNITSKPVGATVLIDTAATALIMIPTIFIGELITGINTEPVMMVMLLISMPFAIGFSALIAFLIAKITEWHYNRSHGLVEE